MAKFDYAGKVRALLAKAASCRELGNDEEAASYEAAAARFMRQYQVAEEEAIAVDPTSAVPTHLVMQVRVTDHLMYSHFPLIARSLAAHTGTMVKVDHINAGLMFTYVGYDTDLRYVEFLWTAAHLMFATRITPTWDDTRSEEDNIFFLRNAGIERREIADKAWGYGSGKDAAKRSKVQRIYIKEAARRGEKALATGLGFNTRAYREAYADGFVTTLQRRLRAARDAADSVGGGLVLPGRTQRVHAAFEELFPPANVPATTYTDPTKDCAKCAKAKTTCNDHIAWRERRWTQADEERYNRRLHSASAQAGRASGQAAAEGVTVQRGHTTNDRRVESGTRALES